MAKNRRGGPARRIPVENLNPKPTKPGVEVLRAMGVNAPPTTNAATPKRAVDAKRSGGLLKSIFRDARGRPMDMTKLERAPRHRWGPAVLLLTLGLLATAAVVGMVMFRGGGKFGNSAVSVGIEAPATVASGAPLTLTVTVRNGEMVALKDTELTLQYPDGFTFTAANPKPENPASQAWKLGGLATGASRTVSITGTLLGSVGQSATFTATASYTPANFSSEFTKTATKALTINTSRLTVAIDGPPSAVSGKFTTFSISVSNSASEKLEGVVLSTVFPDAFTVTTASPRPTDGTARWSLGSLEPGKKATLTLTGTFSGTVGDSVQIPWRASLLASSGETAQGEVNQLVLLVNPALSLAVSVNDSTQDGTLTLGETLGVKVAFANASDLDIPHATLSVSVSGRPVDWSSLQDPAKGKLRASTITWTEAQVAALKDLKPGDSGSVSFTVGTVSNLGVHSAGDRNPSVKVTAVLTPGSGGDATTSPTLTRMVLTRAVVTSESRYTTEDGETVGEGPLPPQVGSSTTYRILWTLGNTVNDVENLTVVATLPEGVQFTGKNITTSAGSLAFDPSARTVRWTLPRLGAGSGTLVPNLSAGFSVSITPTAAQVGTAPLLVGSVALSGTDAFANVPVTAGAEPVTTTGTNDPTTAGKGTVVSGTNTNG